jgi:hypothetical protein
MSDCRAGRRHGKAVDPVQPGCLYGNAQAFEQNRRLRIGLAAAHIDGHHLRFNGSEVVDFGKIRFGVTGDST